MSTEVKLGTRHALRVLRPGPFRRYIIGSAISDTGTWMQIMAQGYVMSTLTNKALLLGMANLAAGLPMLLLTMVGGSAADRFDKRKILLATQYVQIALAISIGFLIMSGKIQIWHILAFAAVLGVSNSFEMPTLNALVPELVTRDEIQSAIAIDRAVFHGSRVVGPSLAGIFISAWGTASAFFGNAVSFIALIIAILSLPARRLGTAEEEEKRDEWNQGRFSVRRQRQTEPRNDRSYRGDHGFHFPNHHRDDAAVCATGARARRESARIFNGRFGSRLGDRRDFPDQHSSRETCAVHDGKRLYRDVRNFRFVPRAKFLCRDWRCSFLIRWG